MEIRSELKYTKDHEWVEVEGNQARVGITDYAQGELGDIIFIEFPDRGVKYKSGDPIGTIEAVKTVADIFTPIDGEILKINVELEDAPEAINKDPYEKGWIIKLCKITKDISDLLQPSDYQSLIQ